jgi:hypothetical protein
MERDGDRQNKMEGHCSTDHSPQRAVVAMEGGGGGEEEEEEEEEEKKKKKNVRLSPTRFILR